MRQKEAKDEILPNRSLIQDDSSSLAIIYEKSEEYEKNDNKIQYEVFGERIKNKLEIGTNKSSYIFHNGHDYSMSEQTMKNKKIKQINKILIEQQLTKALKAIEKAKIETEHVQDSELLIDK